MESAQLAVDWICGSAGGLADQEIASRLIIRIVAAIDWIVDMIASRLIVRIIAAIDWI